MVQVSRALQIRIQQDTRRIGNSLQLCTVTEMECEIWILGVEHNWLWITFIPIYQPWIFSLCTSVAHPSRVGEQHYLQWFADIPPLGVRTDVCRLWILAQRVFLVLNSPLPSPTCAQNSPDPSPHSSLTSRTVGSNNECDLNWTWNVHRKDQTILHVKSMTASEQTHYSCFLLTCNLQDPWIHPFMKFIVGQNSELRIFQDISNFPKALWVSLQTFEWYLGIIKTRPYLTQTRRLPKPFICQIKPQPLKWKLLMSAL